MADNDIARVEAASDWHLMAEFEMKNLAQSKRALKNQIVEAIQILNIPPALLERIYKVTIQAINSLERSARLVDSPPTVRMRILTSAAKADGGGWGFFLVVKPEREPPSNTVGVPYLVDIFLYREHGPDIAGY